MAPSLLSSQWENMFRKRCTWVGLGLGLRKRCTWLGLGVCVGLRPECAGLQPPACLGVASA